MKRIDWIILALLIVGFWVFDVFLIVLVDSVSDYFVAIAIGIGIGQINLVGAWGALAPGKVVVRLPWTVCLGVLMWQAIIIGQHIQGESNGADRLTLGIAITFGVVATQVPLWLARWPFHWRLLPPRFDLQDVRETDAQFNLKQLFLGMFLGSVAMGVIRLNQTKIELQGFRLDSELYVLLPVVAICNAVVTIPSIWMAFQSAQRRLIWAVAWVPYAILVSGIELFLLTLFLGPPGGNENFLLIFTLLNLAQCATVFATLLVLRAAGFRMYRVTSHAVPTENEVSTE